MTDTLYTLLLEPFTTFGFLRKALIACLALSLGCAPVGVLLVLRRMSLMGDALSHSILPGVAVGYMAYGLSLPIMGIGGALSGLLVAGAASIVTRLTPLKEDASFVSFYLIALALGAVIVATGGNQVDLLHILFGSILAVDSSSLYLIATIATVSSLVLAVIYRPLILECFDPTFMASIGGGGSFYHVAFMMLVVVNMVAAFQGLGTLLSLGLMMLPAISARFWVRSVGRLMVLAAAISFISGYGGLILSYHFSWPSGPAIILVTGVFYMISLMFGSHGSFYRYVRRHG